MHWTQINHLLAYERFLEILFFVLSVCTELACRAFSALAPSVRNGFPDNIRLCKTVPTFKKHLKAHLAVLLSYLNLT